VEHQENLFVAKQRSSKAAKKLKGFPVLFHDFFAASLLCVQTGLCFFI